MRVLPSVKTVLFKLDKTDRSLLSLLSKDCRTPNTALGAKLRVSKDTVKYRVMNLRKAQVLQGYTAEINTKELGFMSVHLLVQLTAVDPQFLTSAISSMSKLDFITVIIQYSASYDLEIGTVAKTLESLEENVATILDILSPQLKDYQLLIITQGIKNSILPGDTSFERQLKRKESSPDKLDLQILCCLSEDSTQPLYKIGEKVGMSGDSVRNRIKSLVANGIIKRFIPIINYSVVGLSVYCLLLNIRNPGNRLSSVLLQERSVIWAVRTLGSFNCVAYVAVESNEELHELMIRLRKTFSKDISSSNVFLAYEEFKYTYFPKACMQ